MPGAPITPTPARPVDDAIVDTPWGQWVHDLLLAFPRGIIKTSTAAGVAFTDANPVTQVSVTFPSEAGRWYLILAKAAWRASAAGAVASFDLSVNGAVPPGGTYRHTNVASSGSINTDSVGIALVVYLNATLAACPLVVTGARAGGAAATITPGTWTVSVTDVGGGYTI